MERFPDMILMNEDGTLMRLVTRRAAEWVANMGGIPVERIAHQIIACDENLALDAYMSGLRLRTQSGRSII